MSEEIIARGAEAILIKRNDRLIKRRIKKSYRHKDLDFLLRKMRTRHESRIMEKASKVIDVPKIKDVRDFEIEMEFLEGRKLKHCLNKELAIKLGKAVGRLHSAGIAHNDLTTSNVIVRDGEIFIIDFGLAGMGSFEEFATDLKVLKDCLKATHPDLKVWEDFLRGYREEMKDWEKVLERLDRLERMGRYKIRSPRSEDRPA